MTDAHLAVLPTVEPDPNPKAVSAARGTVRHEGVLWGCQDCLKASGSWVHLRKCLTCGHVGCCDSSPSRHARKHAHKHLDDHPIIRSFEIGENWRYCFIDERRI